MVHHLKRAEPDGNRSPWHTLSEMPASQARNGWSDARVGASARLFIDGHTGHPALPCMPTGEPPRADGAASNTPPTALHLSLSHRTREAARRMRKAVDRSKGETLDEIPMPERSGGWGVVVGGRSRRPHGEYSPWRRPLAFGSTAYKGRRRTKYPANA